jgi:hypothetical protein
VAVSGITKMHDHKNCDQGTCFHDHNFKGHLFS